jgi:hypothetical protein
LVKNPKACDWLYGWWASEDIRVISVQNQQNQLGKPSV